MTVKAMYDYEAPAPEYLSFNNSEVIAVTGTAVRPVAPRLSSFADLLDAIARWMVAGRASRYSHSRWNNFPFQVRPFPTSLRCTR